MPAWAAPLRISKANLRTESRTNKTEIEATVASVHVAELCQSRPQRQKTASGSPTGTVKQACECCFTNGDNVDA